MLPADVALYTWVDVDEVLLQARFKSEWPDALLDARAYWDGLQLTIKTGATAPVWAWIAEQFAPRFNEDHRVIELESLDRAAHRRLLPVTIEEEDQELPEPVFRPLFGRPSKPRALTIPAPAPPALGDDAVPVFAFHSYKGGVGRTTHAIALARQLATHSERHVLLVDGDFEAPGISWHWMTRVPAPPVAYADFLALIHGDPDPGAPDAIALCADRVRRHESNNLYVLPAFRSRDRWATLEVPPEHIAGGGREPFALTGLLSRLGAALDAIAVVVDMRAGLSELAAGLMLDPRVYRVLVTSMSAQSLEGTAEMLRRLNEYVPSQNRDDFPYPGLVINMVPRELAGTSVTDDAEEQLFAAGGKLFRGEDLAEPARIESLYDPRLTVLPLEWDSMLAVLDSAGLPAATGPMVTMLPATEAGSPAPEIAENITTRRERLKGFAERIEYAERGHASDFLRIESLQRLAQDHRSQVPVVIMAGAKGSGKTYTFVQLLHCHRWETFVTKVDDTWRVAPAAEATVVAVLQSNNLDNDALAVSEEASRVNAEAVGTSEPLNMTELHDTIRALLKEDDRDESDWRWQWLDWIAWRCGFEVGVAGAGKRFPGYLEKRDRRVVALFDGLEDLFQDVAANRRQQVALRALVQEVPVWLKQQSPRRIGLVVLIRRDLVQSAVLQNSGQLLALYKNYALTWSDDEALRLAVWTGLHAQALPHDPDGEPLRDWSTDKRNLYLQRLWGQKLGHASSKEAHSAAWVISALSDFRGQIQARDMVRLIRVAAASSVANQDPRWDERLLVPQAVRGALEECSEKKIEEIQTENPILKPIFHKIRTAPAADRGVPFSLGAFDLDASERQLLEEHGVILEDEGQFYMPEIFRHGLKCGWKGVARPKVLALYRRARRGR